MSRGDRWRTPEAGWDETGLVFGPAHRRFPTLKHRTSTRGLPALLTALALSSGCWNGTAEPRNPTVTGYWAGTGVAFGAVENWSFQLEEAPGGAVTGSFTLRVERLVFSGSLRGSHAHPTVSLFLDMVFFGQVVSATYQGQVISQKSIEGEVQLLNDPPRTLDLDRIGA